MRPDSPLEFILQNPVFRLEELQAAYRKMGRSDENARDAIEYHSKQGRLLVIRRGLYAHARFVDPWLIASKLASPSIISHDGALSFHGLAGLGHRITFMTTARTSVAQYNEVIYQPLRVSEDRLSWSRVEEVEREGQSFMVTPLAEALVDCLALLERSPPPVGLMEIFKKARGLSDPSAMIRHAQRYESPLLMSRLGYFLMCARFELDRADRGQLERTCAQEPTYFRRGSRSKKDGYIRLWRLTVPPELFAFWPHNT